MTCWGFGRGAVVQLSFCNWWGFAGICGAPLGVLVGIMGCNVVNVVCKLELASCSSSRNEGSSYCCRDVGRGR